MPPAIIAAGVIGGATIGAAAISSNAAGNASKAATNAANASNALQSSIYNSNKAELQPSIDRGNSAGDLESAFLGIGGDPAASKAALDTYLNSTGYQFNLSQGVNAITQNKATAGLLNSGSTLKALDTFGTNTANAFGQQFVSNLDSISKQGTGAAGTLAGTGTNFANAVSANNNNAANATANADIASSNGISNAIGQALSAYGTSKGLSSFGSGNAPNAFTPQTNLNSGGI